MSSFFLFLLLVLRGLVLSFFLSGFVFGGGLGGLGGQGCSVDGYFFRW